MIDHRKWRLCQRRPEVGFDLQWHWGSWEDLLKSWPVSKEAPGLYIQRWERGSVAHFEIDRPAMERHCRELSGW